MKQLTAQELGLYFDHVNKFGVSLEDYCAAGIRYGVRCCAVGMYAVAPVKALLQGTGILVSGAVAFPGGGSSIGAKLLDVREVIDQGAQEMDYVVNLKKVKDHQWDYVEEEMTRIAQLCRENGVADKVIFECCQLTRDEKIRLCEIALRARPAFIKTSTGTSFGGATPEDVRLMRSVVGGACQIKAAGGIRSYYTALALIEAGADRLGCSSVAAVMEGYRAYLAAQDEALAVH